jgi:hypothetical protein
VSMSMMSVTFCEVDHRIIVMVVLLFSRSAPVRSNGNCQMKKCQVIVTDVAVAPDFADKALSTWPVTLQGTVPARHVARGISPIEENPGRKKRNPDLTRFFLDGGGPHQPSATKFSLRDEDPCVFVPSFCFASVESNPLLRGGRWLPSLFSFC